MIFIEGKKYNVVEDISISETKGYLETTKPCNCTYPPYDGYTNFIPAGETHYHTIYIGGIRGFGRGAYAFWRALKAAWNTRIEKRR